LSERGVKFLGKYNTIDEIGRRRDEEDARLKYLV